MASFDLVGEFANLSVKVISTPIAAIVIPQTATPFSDGETELTILLTATLNLPTMPF